MPARLASTRVCVTYVRHPTAAPTRGVEALAMGCALVVQRGSVLTLYASEHQGVLTYDLEAGDLTSAVRYILDEWPEFQRRAERGAAAVRREFELSRVASQYLRFLTFLAARPRLRPKVDDPVGRLDHVEIVFDDDHCVAEIDQAVQHFQQLVNVVEVQAGRRFVENVERAAGAGPGEFGGKFHAVRLAAG